MSNHIIFSPQNLSLSICLIQKDFIYYNFDIVSIINETNDDLYFVVCEYENEDEKHNIYAAVINISNPNNMRIVDKNITNLSKNQEYPVVTQLTSYDGSFVIAYTSSLNLFNGIHPFILT